MKSLTSTTEVEEAISSEDKLIVIIHFVHTNEPLQLDQALQEEIKRFAVVHFVDIDKVPDFKICTTLFFFHNKNIMVDLGMRNTDKRNWVLSNHQQFVELVENMHEAAQRGLGMLVSPWEYHARFLHVLELFEN